MSKRITALRGQLNDRCESGNIGKIIDDDGSRSLRILLDSKSNIVFVGKRGRLFTAQRIQALVLLAFLLIFCVVALVLIGLSIHDAAGQTPVHIPSPYVTPNFHTKG